MKKNPHKGKFIVLEGLDGCGSSTQAELLLDWIREKNGDAKEVQLTQEPTNSLMGGLVRSQLQDDWHASTECLQLLFSADRAYHLEKKIIPWLKEGITVISDRYFFSTIAYGAAETGKYDWFKELNKYFPLPDLTILFTTPAEECLRRIKKTRPHAELYENKKTLSKVLKKYKKLSEEFENIKLVDGQKSREEVFRDIKEEINARFKNADNR